MIVALIGYHLYSYAIPCNYRAFCNTKNRGGDVPETLFDDVAILMLHIVPSMSLKPFCSQYNISSSRSMNPMPFFWNAVLSVWKRPLCRDRFLGSRGQFVREAEVGEERGIQKGRHIGDPQV